jgi:hypothetical protein
MSSRRVPAGLGVTPLLAAVLLVTPTASADAQVTPAPAVREVTVTVLPYGSKDWKYQQVAWGDDPRFYEPGFNDNSWPYGQEGFGTTGGPCAWNNPTDVKTHWDLNTDMLVRHTLIIPSDAKDVRISGTIDNDATVYLNGHQLQYVQSGSCVADAIDAVAPAGDLKKDSLLAIRGHDTGVADYLNVEVTYRLSL